VLLETLDGSIVQPPYRVVEVDLFALAVTGESQESSPGRE
jgi:hypothetical protein